jgi:flagellar hook-length control protein FliK
MQNPITFLAPQPAANAGNQAKSSAISNDNSASSFKHVLSKEIAENHPAAKDRSAKQVESKATPQDLNRNTTSQPAKIEPLADDEKKPETVPGETDQTNGVQLIALVESLAQFSQSIVDKPNAPTTTDNPGIAITTSIPTASDIPNNIDTSASSKNLKAETSVVHQAPYSPVTPPTNDDKITSLLDKASNNLPLADQSKVQASQVNDTALANSAPILVSIAMKLPAELKVDPKLGQITPLSTDLKTTMTLASQTEEKKEFKIDAKQDGKTDLKTELTIDSKVDLKNDSKKQEAVNIKEQSIKTIEANPTPQNFAQQIAVSSGQIIATSEVGHLAPRVGTSAWNQSVGQKIVWMVAGGQQTAELTLNPPDLGPMQVVLSVNNDQANATFISAHPDVREALESAMPKLRQMMNDAGVQLSGFSVKSESSHAGAQYAGDRSSPRSKSTATGSVNSVSASTPNTGTTKHIPGNGVVDTFA